MRRSSYLVLGGMLLGCAAAVHGDPEAAGATALTFIEGSFASPQVTSDPSGPGRFTVSFEREMPTPGWRFEIDAVEIDPDSGRIEARISEIAPDGITSQVLTKARCSIPLGPLPPGRFVLEIRSRRGTSAPHEPVQAFVIHARP
jgi:hypothetical protein